MLSSSIKQLLKQKETLIFALLFVLLRLFSYLLAPYPDVVNGLLLLLLPIFIYLCFTSPTHTFLILLTELLLGAGGHYLELFGISVRTLLLLTVLLATVVRTVWTRSYQHYPTLPRPFLIGIALVLIFAAIATTRGLLSGHSIAAVQDAIPYLYLLLIAPAYLLYKEHPWLRSATVRLGAVYIVGTAFFTFLTFTLFSTGTTMIHEGFYKWFRDVNIGKITDLGDNFFRTVESSHLLLVPLILFLTALLIQRTKQSTLVWTLHALLLLTLSINFSRGYILALLAGLGVLIIQQEKLRWFLVSSYTVLLFLISFVTLHTIASGFTNPGLDELGLRSSSIVDPTTETSSATRMMILPAIIDQIKQAPLFGQGLGSSVSFYNAHIEAYQTTREYDWGYLEMIAEFGIAGALILFGALLTLGFTLLRTAWTNSSTDTSQTIGLLGALVALLVMHLTAPALTHVFGVGILCAILILSLIKHTETSLIP